MAQDEERLAVDRDRYRPIGTVTTRELSRNTPEVLEKVRNRGITLLITRKGVPVAALTPLRDEVLDDLAPPRSDATVEEGAEVELDELQRRALEQIGHVPTTLEQIAARVGLPYKELVLPVCRLEISGLVQRVRGAYRSTPRGARVAKAHPAGAGGAPEVAN